MSITKEQQQAFDDALVPREQRLRIDPPFEEEILAFIRELGYPRNMKSLSNVKVEILPQPWITFGTINNKCLSGKVTGLDLLRLSRAQILFGVSRKNKDMYYPRFTKVIINHFMSQDQSILRRNKVDWHMANEDPILTIMRFIHRNEVVQKYGAILPDNLTNQAMKMSSDDKDDDEVSLSKDDDDDAENDNSQDDDNEQTESDNDGDDFVHPKFSTHDEDEEDKDKEGSDLRIHTPFHYESADDEAYDDVTQGDNIEEEKLDKEEDVNKLYRDVNVNLEGMDTKITYTLLPNVQATQVVKDTHVIMTVVTPEAQQQSSSVSSCFISNMLNLNLDIGIDSILNLNTESTSLVYVPVTTNVEMPLSSVTTLPPPLVPLIQPQHQTPVLPPIIVPNKQISWMSSDDKDDDEVSLSKDDDDDAENDNSQDDDNEQTESDNDGDDFVHPKFSTHDEDEEDKDKEGSDLRIHTPFHYESADDEAYDDVTQGDNIEEEKLDKEEDVNKLYRDVNVNLEGMDTKITYTLLPNVQATQVVKDTHVIMTVVTPEAQQQRDESGIDSDLGTPIQRIDPDNMPYSVTQEIARCDEIKSEHLYSASANEIDDKKHELKDLPHHLE
nr:hypothetical protein [Tanacetum cinerariifolium]